MYKHDNESKTIITHILCDCRCKFDGKNEIKKKLNINKCQYKCKKSINYRVCKENYAWNHKICTSGCNTRCRVNVYLENYTCIKC